MERRTLLKVAGVAALATACGTPDRPVPAQGALTVTAGTVTNPTGTVNGYNMATLQDVFVGNWGGIVQPPPAPNVAQWQMLVMLGSAPDLCARVGMQGNGHYGAGEITLRIVLLGTADVGQSAPIYPPTADLPLVFNANVAANVSTTTSDGTHRWAKPYANKAKTSGNAGTDIAASGGTVTLTRADNIQYEGSYNLQFPNSGTAAGSFVAPWCGTAP